MPDTSTPAQDLAALDRVAVIASVAGLMTSGLAVLLERLRILTAVEHDRRLALGRAYTLERGIASECDAEDYLSYAAAILTAAASMGAEIVWPTPDSAEVADRAAGEGSAPKATGVSDDRADWEKLLDGDHPDYILVHPVPPSESTPREKILAEVAGYRWDDRVPGGAGPTGLVNSACDLARRAAVAGSEGEPHRVSLIAAASMLVLAVERLDGAR